MFSEVGSLVVALLEVRVQLMMSALVSKHMLNLGSLAIGSSAAWTNGRVTIDGSLLVAVGPSGAWNDGSSGVVQVKPIKGETEKERTNVVADERGEEGPADQQRFSQ